MLQRVWRKESLLHCFWECKLVQPPCKIVRRFLKLKTELPYSPAIPLPGIYLEYLEKDENSNSKRYMYPKFIAALFIIAKTWRQPKSPSTEEWIKKMCCIYIYIYIYVYICTHKHIYTQSGILVIHKK